MFRDFVYISDAKVDLLLSHIPDGQKKKISEEIGFDLKIIKASFREEHSTNDNRYNRLLAAEKFLLDDKDTRIGSPGDLELPWIQGTIEAKYVELGPGAVMFVSKLNNTYVGLGGTSIHMIGFNPTRVERSYSFTPTLIERLYQFENQKPELALQLPEHLIKSTISGGRSQGFKTWTTVIESAYLENVITQHYKFLAKRLVTTSDHRNMNYTLATPLYVEQIIKTTNSPLYP